MKIQTKLFFAFLAGSIVLVGSMYALMQWSFDRGMLDYINERELNSQSALAEWLGEQYERGGSWDFIRNNHRLWRQLMERQASGPEPPPGRHQERPAPHGDGAFPPPGHRPGPPRPRVILLDRNKDVLFGPPDYDNNSPLLDITAGDRIVGWLTLAPREHLSNAYDVGFVREQQTAFLVISGLLLLLSAAVSYPLAIVLTRPVKQLAQGTSELTSGNYAYEIQHHSQDELGKLTRDFNHLARTLSANESARKRWIADISHELRTPLAISRGELEAMLEGVRPATTDNIASTHQEILRLQRIVEDLYELTNADIGALRYQFAELDLNQLVQAQVAKHQPTARERRIQLHCQSLESPAPISGDEIRLSQLINNLLDNSLKYTDPGGRVAVTLITQGHHAVLTLEDSAPGVSDADMDKLFDPLYRVESSRNRKTGGSGLGLAICKKIVEGHNGNIRLAPSSLGGLSVTIELPVDQ